MDRAVWITWENQRRNKTLSKELAVELHQLEANTHRLLRYPLLIVRTFYTLLKTRPKIIFSQNPSIFLAMLVVLYGQVFRKTTVVDCHNAGIFPFDGKYWWATRMSYYIFRNSSLIIVTNDALKLYVEEQGGQAFILPDPFPELKGNSSLPLAGDLNFLLICSWAEDEPYEEVINAFSSLNKNWTLYITGNSKGREKNISGVLPDNVSLTGYISDKEFDDLLCSCDCVIDLTTREDCLVCGAYEAVSAGKPLILSDTRTLKDYFQGAAIYTENTVEHIRSAVTGAAENLSVAAKQVVDYRNKQKIQWNEMRDDLIKKINESSF